MPKTTMRVMQVGVGRRKRTARAQFLPKGHVLSAAAWTTGKYHVVEEDGFTACGRRPFTDSRWLGKIDWPREKIPTHKLDCEICAQRWHEEWENHTIEKPGENVSDD